MPKARILFVFAFVAGLVPHVRVLGQDGPLIVSPLYPYSLATPAHSWEVGLHTGVPLGLSDIDALPGMGGGIHLRRALDYVFSIRGDLLAAKLTNEDNNDGRTRTTWQSGTFEIIASLNSLVWSDRKYRKSNLYGLAGIGINRFRVEVKKSISPDILPKDFTWQSHGGLGMGLAFRFSEKLNLGLESKAWILFGKNDDLLDGVKRQQGDVLFYTGLRLNLNLADPEKKTEPLYWVNPLGMLLHNVSEMQKHPGLNLADSDGDGVIDLFDLDHATPLGVLVDIRGLPLDSDDDNIPDHEDALPYIPSDMSGNVVGGPYPSEAEMLEISLETGPISKGEMPFDPPILSGDAPLPSGDFDNSPSNLEEQAKITNWFLPPIHFDIDSDKIRPVDYQCLESTALMMEKDTNLRLVVMGFSEKTTSKGYNKLLAYKRAKRAIDHLEHHHQISPERLVLQYNVEEAPLVPSSGSNLMNRRTEFRVAAPTDAEMPEPPQPKMKPKKRWRKWK